MGFQGNKHETILTEKMGEYVQTQLKNLWLDVCLNLEVRMPIIELFLLDVYSFSNSKLQWSLFLYSLGCFMSLSSLHFVDWVYVSSMSTL